MVHMQFLLVARKNKIHERTTHLHHQRAHKDIVCGQLVHQPPRGRPTDDAAHTQCSEQWAQVGLLHSQLISERLRAREVEEQITQITWCFLNAVASEFKKSDELSISCK
mgnify:CR=1 FL=1